MDATTKHLKVTKRPPGTRLIFLFAHFVFFVVACAV
jgi:hypothetical protein